MKYLSHDALLFNFYETKNGWQVQIANERQRPQSNEVILRSYQYDEVFESFYIWGEVAKSVKYADLPDSLRLFLLLTNFPVTGD